MRKSPFSTPRGSGGQQGFKWKSNERRGGRGYVPYMNNSSDNNYSPKMNQNSNTNDDFIPFDTSSPSCPEKIQNNFYDGSRGGRNKNFHRSPGYRNDNFNSRLNFNNFSPPFNNSWRHSRGRNNKMLHHRMPRREIDISQYVDVLSFLEDPWKDLMDEHDKSIIKENFNDITMDSIVCESDYSNSFDDSTLNTSNCSQDDENQSINEQMNISSIDEVESNKSN